MGDTVPASQRSRLLHPSLMCMSPLRVQQDLATLCTSFDAVHVDIMDGHFCKSIHLSPAFVEAIRPECTVPIDVHLMVEYPDDYLDDLIRAGADSITLHVETITGDAHRLIDKIRKAGCRAAVALRPTTPLAAVECLLPLIDMVTVLGVEPGFIGQELLPLTPARLRRLARLRDELGADFVIQADGGVRATTLDLLANAGADCFVLGRAALFGRSADLEAACRAAVIEFRRPIHGAETASV